MKTLMLILLTMAIAAGLPVHAYSLLNLPETTPHQNPASGLSSVVAITQVAAPVADNTRMFHKAFTDTIVIDLDEVIVESSFPRAAQACITQQVPYPAFAQEQGIEGAVVIKFVFDDFGRARVEEAMSNDPRLAHYVKQKIENLTLKNCIVDMHKAYYMRFLFKLY